MPGETIAEYQWRIPLDEWSGLCDNVLSLNRSAGLAGTPFKLNPDGICPPPCSMCVTGVAPVYCVPELETNTIAPDNEEASVTFCRLSLQGDFYRFAFSSGDVFDWTVPANVYGEDLAQTIADELANFIALRSEDGVWQYVSLNVDQLENRVLIFNYPPGVTGTLALEYNRP